MQNKNIFAFGSIVAAIAFMFFIYPSFDGLINAGQISYKQEPPTFTNAHQISFSSSEVITHYFGKDVVDKIMKQPGCAG